MSAPLKSWVAVSQCGIATVIMPAARVTTSVAMRDDVRTTTMRLERVRSEKRIHSRELHALRRFASVQKDLIHRELHESATMRQTRRPVALVVPKGVLER